MSWVISRICRQQIPDTQCGFRLVKRPVLEHIKLMTSNFEIESETLIRAARLGYKIGSIPIETIYSKNYSSDSSIIYTNREMDVIRLLAKGLSSKAIASRLNISSHTVDKHRRNMLKKASKNNTQELVHDALKQGWL